MAGRHVDGRDDVQHRHAALRRGPGRAAGRGRQLAVVVVRHQPRHPDLHLRAAVAPRGGHHGRRADRAALRRAARRAAAWSARLHLRRSHQRGRHGVRHARGTQGRGGAGAGGRGAVRRRRGPEPHGRDRDRGAHAGVRGDRGSVGRCHDGFPPVLPRALRRDPGRGPGHRRAGRPDRAAGAAHRGWFRGSHGVPAVR